MRVAVEKLDGVESAEVSLNEGRVRVRFAPQTGVTIAELRRTIRNQGFSPQEATLTVSARMERRNGAMVAVVPGSGASYIVAAEADVQTRLSAAAGSEVVLEGRIEMDDDDVTPNRIQVMRVVEER